MKNLILIILSLLNFSLNPLLATVYTTTKDGNINGNIWSPSKPSSPLAAGDEIVIAHNVKLNIDFKVRGKMTINSGASLYVNGGNKELIIGGGSTTGELINNGTIDIKVLKVKGDNSTVNLTAPSITNNGSITVDRLRVGDDAGAGMLNNTLGNDITVNGNGIIANILNNEGEMIITNKLRLNGGTVQGAGSIETPKIVFEQNNGRAGTINDQDICDDSGSSSEPEIKIKDGASYSSLSDFVDNETISGSNHSISESEFYSCGTNALGLILPVELTYFAASKYNQKVMLEWETALELNSSHFIVERSTDGINYIPVGELSAAGESYEIQSYSFIDQNPLHENYYRLKQVDFDGSYEYSDIVMAIVDQVQNDKLSVFPSIA